MKDDVMFFTKNKHLTTFTYNTKITKYADGKEKLSYKSYEVTKGYPNINNRTSRKGKEVDEYRRYKTLYKTKQNIIDLAYHNGVGEKWEYFATLTFDDNKVNANNYEEVSHIIHKWLDNMKHQNPGMKYIIAPEPHKNGRIHYHGIFKNVPNWNLEKARNPKTNRLIKKNGKQIYNLTNYKYGYTTISEVEDLEGISVYISKYITKNLIEFDYKKRYWCSQGLEKPKIEYAHFNEDTLKFYIEKKKISNYKEIEKENFKGIFATLSIVDNLYYVNFCM